MRRVLAAIVALFLAQPAVLAADTTLEMGRRYSQASLAGI